MLFSATLARKGTYHSTYLDEDIVDLLGGTFNIPSYYQCQVVPIDPGYDARPDLISDALYGDEMNADILNRLNGPGNPFEITDGQYYIVPGAEEIENFYCIPAKEWSEEYLSSQALRPKAKARNEKRKPNEAVIGDKRFNIDRLSKIIVY